MPTLSPSARHRESLAFSEALAPLDNGDIGLTKSRLAALCSLEATSGCASALVRALSGNVSAITDWLFELPADYDGPVAWLASGRDSSGKPSFLWLAGHLHPASSYVCSVSGRVREALLAGPQPPGSLPPRLRFVVPAATCMLDQRARVRDGTLTSIDNLGLLRVDGKGGAQEDIHQRLLLSVPALTRAFAAAGRRLHHFGTAETIAGINVHGCEENPDVIDMLHAELHNIGHFVGDWPFSLAEKQLRSYEPIEELRACLMSVRLSALAGLPSLTTMAIAQRVTLGRIFGYGANAFQAQDRAWNTIREIATATVLATRLFERGTLAWGGPKEDRRIAVNYSRLVPLLDEFLSEIEAAERDARSRCLLGLREIAKNYLVRAFPERSLPGTIQDLYSGPCGFVV